MATREEAKEIMKIINLYEKASGQSINLDKSSVFFGKNTSFVLKAEVCTALENVIEVIEGSYLGLRTVVSRSKTLVFKAIKDRVVSRIESWKNKFHSFASKEVLLKSIALAMPIYVMSYFKITVKLCKDIESTLANFWWGKRIGNIKCIDSSGVKCLRPKVRES
ncbi:hypothetical protein ACH5RR_041495 [Cinchona calisaya]|uniref:Reverse transcriptase n=1 Tax=Cinchona calisaya TaxID=153742 RepID=A0ABD2XUF4_9GENT